MALYFTIWSSIVLYFTIFNLIWLLCSLLGIDFAWTFAMTDLPRGIRGKCRGPRALGGPAPQGREEKEEKEKEEKEKEKEKEEELCYVDNLRHTDK